jgi:S1-C subfamily serine protease
VSVSLPETHLAQEAIAALVDGELLAGPAHRAAKHLFGCAQCRLAVEAQREAKEALHRCADVAVPGDLLSRLQAIPFTADVPGDGGGGTLTADPDQLTITGSTGSWSVSLHREHGVLSPDQARWLRRGFVGTLAALGLGVAALSLTLPSGHDAPTAPSGPVARAAAAHRDRAARRPHRHRGHQRHAARTRRGHALTPPSGSEPGEDPLPVDDSPWSRPSGQAGSFDTGPVGSGVGRTPSRPSPAPAPTAGQQAAFGRPADAQGSFVAERPPIPERKTPPPPPEAVRRAFAPLPGASGLQDPPGGRPARRRTATGPWWKPDALSDPWRDPGSVGSLGPPAVYDEEQTGPVVIDAAGRRRVRVRDLSIRLSVLVLLAVLVVGAAGGAIGWYLTKAAGQAPLHVPTALSQVSPGVTRQPGSVADIAARVMPAVVSIEVRVGQAGDTGSGVVVDGKNGYIVTNNHVISSAAGVEGAEIRAVFTDGSGSPARIVGRDPASDVAVLKVEKPGLVTASLGNSDKLVVGDPVVAIGSPLGLAGTVTSGIVSALHRPVRLSGEGSDTNAVINAVQTDAPINPGNSGGALVDSTGAVIGINTAMLAVGGTGSTGGGSTGLGFAIPINTVRDVAQQLISTGKAVHSTLGVNTRSVTDGTRDGALVLNVEPGGPADKAGVHEQDVVIAVNGKPVGSSEELQVTVDQHRPGDTITLEVVRNGSSTTLQVTLATA